MRRVLLLNASYEPLNFISDQRALRLVLKNKAEIFMNMNGERSTWDGVKFSSPTTEFDVPATIRLMNRVNGKWRPPRFRKKVLFNRDSWQCQYCREGLYWDTATIDHVVPRSHGGPTSWLNCVAACRRCNRHKANRTPEQAQMNLIKQPVAPSALHFWDVRRSQHWHDDWNDFVPQDN